MAEASVETPIACKLEVFTPDERARHRELGKRVIRQRRSVREVADGWAIELPADPQMCRDALDFALLERRCCPFLTFSLEIRDGEGPLWVHLTGREGVKEFLETTRLVR